MGCLFVPLTTAAVSQVANTDAGLASALLNVGQQVGGALGLSVMTTVFGTAGRNYANSHQGSLRAHLGQVTGGDHQLAGRIAQRLQSAGSNGLRPDDVTSFVASLPPGNAAAARTSSAGRTRTSATGCWPTPPAKAS